MATAQNTFDGLHLLGDSIRKSLIICIPHSSIKTPNYAGFIIDIEEEINKLTDFHTDKIFKLPFSTVRANFSRLFCNVERLPDEVEPMFKLGMGIYQTKTSDGSPLRHDIPELKKYIIKKHYIPYHNKVEKLIQEKLTTGNVATIIDCHSFNDTPLPFETDTARRPDICIGTDEFHTPSYLREYVVSYFQRLGYDVKVNSPYSGSFAPMGFYKKTKAVESIMIEINKKLYEHSDIKIKVLNKQMRGLFEF